MMPYLHAPPGTLDHLDCPVCGAPCLVQRDVVGPTCWAAAMGGQKARHDRFTCAHRDEAWHRERAARRG